MEQAAEILKQHWGYHSFRPMQENIIASVLSQKDTLALLPTGAGKSLCYQVPALMMDGFCLVISPLIALMQDQVERLKNAGIMAACIHAGMHFTDVKRTLENMLHGPYKLLYISPERLQTDLFNQYLPAFDISLIAVDEAHCISQWGHDFRPDYLKIAQLREVFTRTPILALTASATQEVQTDIIAQLRLSKPVVFRQSFERSNIFYSALYTENKNNAVLEHAKELRGNSIIYCRSRKQTESISRSINANSVNAVAYHAGMARDRRQEAQQLWMQDKVSIMVATTAFGMGIDKSTVRSVLHYDVPEHLEAYYQESGRAGRDGLPARSVLLYNNNDIKRLEDSIALQYPPEAYLRQVYQSVVEYLQIPIGTEPHRYYPFDLADFCKKFKLEPLPATYALRLLAQEGLWTISDAVFNPATIYFTADRRELDNISRLYTDSGIVITALLRLYGTVFQYPTVVNINTVARRVKMKKEQLEHLLIRLQHMGILEYNTPADGPQLFFHHYRVDSRHLLIDLQRIESLRRRHRLRIHSIIDYIKNESQCRTQKLLAYFNEAAPDTCRHCDICTRREKINFDSKSHETNILKIVSAHHSMSLQVCIEHFPVAIRQDILALIRAMVDSNKLRLMPGNVLQV